MREADRQVDRQREQVRGETDKGGREGTVSGGHFQGPCMVTVMTDCQVRLLPPQDQLYLLFRPKLLPW